MTRQTANWLMFAFLLAVLPWVFSSSLGHNMLSQMGIAIIVCLSYNILLGQGGMLSFGHAVYSGLGAFLTMHALNLVSAGSWHVPVSLLPLVGGGSAMLVAVLLGWVSTQKAATPFAMITLGVGELVWAMSLMFPGFFGGEGGISGNRVTGTGLAGITWGPQIELYALIALHVLVCAWLMHALTRTPLGRMLNAVRDNPERVAFVGYDPRVVRYIAFCIAAFFAGMAGGLAALHFEIVTSEVVSAQRSGAYLLFVFLGGTGLFIGPIVGGVLMVVASVLLSEWTQAWLLYLGLCFVLMVMWLPGGLAGWMTQHVQLWRRGLLQPMWPQYLRLLLVAVPGLAGVAVLVEMLYHLQLSAALSPVLVLRGWPFDTSSTVTWVAVLAWACAGCMAVARAWRPLHASWTQAQGQLNSVAPSANEVSATAVTSDISNGNPHARSQHAGSVLLELQGVTKRFGATDIIRGVDLQVRRGERVALIGPNGAGKSTLFNLISGLHVPTGGRIDLAGHSLVGLPPHRIHRLGLSRSFQISQVFTRMSVFENLRCSVLWGQGHRYGFWRNIERLSDVNARAEQLMHDVRLTHRRDDFAMNLTYAEQRALELGITLGSGSELILLDEPTAGMSRAETAYMVELIRRLTQDKTLVMVEHDMDVVFGLADRVAVLVYGQVMAFDTPERVRADPEVRRAYLGDPSAKEATC